MFWVNIVSAAIIQSVTLAVLNIQADLSCHARRRQNIVEELSDLECSHETVLIFDEQEYQCVQKSTISHSIKRDNLTCDFNIDETQHHTESFFPPGGLPPDVNTSDISWSCRLAKPSQICNGHSQCLTDECGCENSGNLPDVFYCADGLGCITWDKLCDNIQHCKDGSDECSCPDYLVFFSSEIGQWVCFSEEHYCNNIAQQSKGTDYRSIFNETPDILKGVNCSGKMQGSIFPKVASPLTFCRDFIHEATDYSEAPQELGSELCRVNCTQFDGFSDGWDRFCNNIVAGLRKFPFSFFCNGTDPSQSLPLIEVCDGKTDCSNGADEFWCPLPDRFHCDPNVTAEWVHIDKVCDSVKDCSNGADECGTCKFEALSSSEFLIQSKIIVAVASIMGTLIIMLNVREGCKCWKTDCRSKNKAIDRIFLLQIFLYDSMMGLYLCCIVLAAIILKFKGDYCLIEQDWRASLFCSALGVIFSMSSHGSLLAIALVSISRFLTCHSIVAEIKKRSVIVVTIIGACLNILHSLLPLIPTDAIQNTFRTAIFLENLNENPFFSSNPINLSRLTEVYNRMYHQEGDHEIKTMTKRLNNITSRHNIFDFTEIGYYGNTGLCIHNIFKDNGDQHFYQIYKILYCTVLLILLSTVSIAYLKIVFKQRRSQIAVGIPNAAGSNTPAVSALTLKVALMIGSQLVCWISFIVTVLYFQYMTKNPASPMVFEVFALVVIPVNSFLNPMFYSELYKNVIQFLSAQCTKLKVSFRSRKIQPEHPSDCMSIELQPCTQSKTELTTDRSVRNDSV